jgi:hypothetical protein
MYDLKSVELELHNARQARIAAELACCDVEELAAAIRQSHSLGRSGRRRGVPTGAACIELAVKAEVLRPLAVRRRPWRLCGPRSSPRCPGRRGGG